MAHKKGLGSSRNGRDSNPKFLGVKVFAGQTVTGGEIIDLRDHAWGTRVEVAERALPFREGDEVLVHIVEPHMYNVDDAVAKIDGYIISVRGGGRRTSARSGWCGSRRSGAPPRRAVLVDVDGRGGRHDRGRARRRPPERVSRRGARRRQAQGREARRRAELPSGRRSKPEDAPRSAEKRRRRRGRVGGRR